MYKRQASNVIITLLVAITTQIQVKQCIHYQFRELAIDLMPTLLMSGVMVLLVRLITFITIPDAAILVLQLFVGFLAYMVMSVISKNKNFFFLYNYIKKKIKISRRKR